MKVILKEREYNYTSDFPDDWKESSGDFFKYPVQIGKYSTFIKRFERKKPEDISGWNLLMNIKGRFIPNLPRVFDIESAEENNKEVYYLFQEYLEGQTLDKVIASHEPIDLQRLTNDLFIALKNLHDSDFWYADFCPKNIFFEEERKRFLLIDLDSAQKISHHPQQDMWADKEYWALVFDFYKKVLGNKEFKSTDISGSVLNYLMIIFLVLRLKITQGENEYRPDELYSILPTVLDKTDPAFRTCFSQALSEETEVHFTQWASEVKSLIFSAIIDIDINIDFDELIKSTRPIIQFFTSDKKNVTGGNPFHLTWKADNVISLELHKNGILSKKINAGENSITLEESFDGKARTLQYTLIATNNAGVTKSEPVTVLITEDEPVIPDIETNHSTLPIVEDEPTTEDVKTVHNEEEKTDEINNEVNESDKDPVEEVITKQDVNSNTKQETPQNNVINTGGNGDQIYTNEKKEREDKLRKIRLAVLGLLLAIIVMSSIIVYYFSSPGKVKISILRYNLTEGNSLVIFSNNFPKDSSNVQVLFNKVKAAIIEYSKTSMRVIVPTLGNNLGNGNVKVAVVIKGDTTYADHDLVIKENSKPTPEIITTATTVSPTTDSVYKFKPVKIVLKNSPVKKDKKSDTIAGNTIVVKPPEVIKEKKRNFNIYDFVTVNSGDIKKRLFGGMKNVKITVENNSPYDIDSVSVEVSYLKGNEEVVKNDIKTFTKIASHNSATIELPGSGKAKKVDLKIVSVSSKQMDNDLQ